MPSSDESAQPSQNTERFADLFLTLAERTERDDNSRFTRQLEDDVVTVSYEQALRKHQRRWTPADQSAAHPSFPASELHEADLHCSAEALSPRQSLKPDGPLGPARASLQKTASVTVRLTTEECANLHARAAEAGMSVSAYLRSCIFEAESLRAQVKEALAEIRTPDPSPKKPCAAEPASAPRERGWSRFLAGWHRPKQAATA